MDGKALNLIEGWGPVDSPQRREFFVELLVMSLDIAKKDILPVLDQIEREGITSVHYKIQVVGR